MANVTADVAITPFTVKALLSDVSAYDYAAWGIDVPMVPVGTSVLPDFGASYCDEVQAGTVAGNLIDCSSARVVDMTNTRGNPMVYSTLVTPTLLKFIRA